MKALKRIADTTHPPDIMHTASATGQREQHSVLRHMQCRESSSYSMLSTQTAWGTQELITGARPSRRP